MEEGDLLFQREGETHQELLLRQRNHLIDNRDDLSIVELLWLAQIDNELGIT